MQRSKLPEYESVKRTTLKNLTFTIMDMTFHGDHLHHDLEIIQVLSGTLHVRSAGEVFDLDEGEVALFNMNTAHAFQSDPLTPCTVLVIHVNPSFCIEYYPDIEKIRFLKSQLSGVLPEDALADVKRTCFNIGYNYFGERPAYQFRCLSDLYRLMGIFIGLLPHQILPEEAVHRSCKNQKRMSRVMDYINEHFREKLTLEEIASREQLSATYLSHLFKQALHQSFQSYINQLRFEYAIFLVQTTDWKMIDICNESGFSDSKYLNKMFMQYFHMTPKVYRTTFLKASGRHLHPEGVPEETDRKLFIYSQTESIAILRAHHQYHCDMNIKINSIVDEP